MCVPMAGIFCVKYKRNIEIINAMHPFNIIFSPACGGSQKFNNVNRIITEKLKAYNNMQDRL